MTDIKFRRMSIIYGQGMELCFEFPIQVTDGEMSHRIEEALKMPSVSISTGGAIRHSHPRDIDCHRQAGSKETAANGDSRSEAIGRNDN